MPSSALTDQNTNGDVDCSLGDKQPAARAAVH
jgi:hypothetical protein